MEFKDFSNLNFEFESLYIVTKQEASSLSNLTNFFKSFLKSGEYFYLNSKKGLDSILLESNSSDKMLGKCISKFGSSFDAYFSQFKDFLNNIDRDIVEPMVHFQKQLVLINQETLSDLKNIITSITDSKKNLEKIKNKYFEICRQAQDQQKSVLKTFTNKEKKRSTTDEEIYAVHDSLLKYKSQAENHAQLYKYELSKTNKNFDENERKYLSLVDKLKINEESRVFFTKCQLEKFSKFFEEYAMSSCDFLNKINSSISQISTEGDFPSFNDILRRNKELRIPREEYISYDTYKRNLETSPKLQSLNTTQISNEIQNSSLSQFQGDINLNTEFNENDYEIVSFENHHENQQEKMYNEFLQNLYLEKELSVDEVGKIIQSLYENIENSQIFIDMIITKERKKLSIKLKNYQNLIHYSNILITICLNLLSNENESYDINYAIIFLAERTFYIGKHKEKKIYLCELLSKNKIFSSRKYWVDLMELKINRKIDSQIQKYIKDNTNNTVSKSPKKSMFGKIKNIFNPKDKLMNQIPEFISETVYDKIRCNEALNVVNEFIPHFANFAFDLSEAIEIIVELSSKYNFQKEKISHFVTKLNSNIFTIKNRSNKHSKAVNNKSLISMKTAEKRLKCLKFAFNFLIPEEYLNLLLINKKHKVEFEKKIYKKLLLGDFTLKFETRLKLWQNILKVNEVKNKVNYQDVLKQLSENSILIQSNVFEIIGLDVQRTHFESDIIENRKAISNILKVIAVTKPKINYCQGMNYIASFIYQLLKNEEESFYLMLAIFENTDFCIIFYDDLLKLKQYFHVFDRLVYLFLPEISNFFKNNQIIVSYFSSPWFITLFTNAFQYVNDSQSLPSIILRIWDEFFIYGWKSIMKTGIILLKYYENSLVQLRYEDLLHFLINDAMKSGFFNNNNLEYYIDAYNSIPIKKGLINNLENENIQETKFRDLEEKRILDNYGSIGPIVSKSK